MGSCGWISYRFKSILIFFSFIFALQHRPTDRDGYNIPSLILTYAYIIVKFYEDSEYVWDNDKQVEVHVLDIIGITPLIPIFIPL